MNRRRAAAAFPSVISGPDSDFIPTYRIPAHTAGSGPLAMASRAAFSTFCSENVESTI
jgi:hypothetical protein